VEADLDLCRSAAGKQQACRQSSRNKTPLHDRSP
jgi:hypothetical protein